MEAPRGSTGRGTKFGGILFQPLTSNLGLLKLVGLGGLEPPTSPLSVVAEPSATEYDGLLSC
jgi:hypothetical protein